MRTVAIYVTDRQAHYLERLAKQWKTNKSWVGREIIEFHVSNFTSLGSTIPASTTTHTDGENTDGNSAEGAG